MGDWSTVMAIDDFADAVVNHQPSTRKEALRLGSKETNIKPEHIGWVYGWWRKQCERPTLTHIRDAYEKNNWTLPTAKRIRKQDKKSERVGQQDKKSERVGQQDTKSEPTSKHIKCEATEKCFVERFFGLPTGLVAHVFGFVAWSNLAFLTSRKWYDTWLQAVTLPTFPLRMVDVKFRVKMVFTKEIHHVWSDEENEVACYEQQEGVPQCLAMHALLSSQEGDDVRMQVIRDHIGIGVAKKASWLKHPELEDFFTRPPMEAHCTAEEYHEHCKMLARIKACVLQCDGRFGIKGLGLLRNVVSLTLHWRSHTPCSPCMFKWEDVQESLPRVTCLHLVGFSNLPRGWALRDFRQVFPNLKTLYLLHCSTSSVGYVPADIDLNDIFKESVYTNTIRRCNVLPFRVYWNSCSF